MDYKLELVLVPVSDVDRAKDFYVNSCGFTLDVDHQPNEQFRVVQITPPANLPAGTTNVPIKADVRWLECNADLCLPGRATLSITADVGDAAVPQMADQFARWQRRTVAGRHPNACSRNAPNASTSRAMWNPSSS